VLQGGWDAPEHGQDVVEIGAMGYAAPPTGSITAGSRTLRPAMTLTRTLTFWIAMLAAVLATVVLLREILLPFVAGMVLAYLLDPLANRLERLGMNRLLATLAIVALFVIGVVILIVLTAPIIVREFAYFIDNSPRYLQQLQALATDPERPWLRKIVAEGLGTAEKSISELATLGASWLSGILRSVWSGGQALISVFSLAIVTPIVACYLVYDWPRMIAVVDHWVPPVHRETVRALAREIDDTIGGFVRGQSVLCLILGAFYALTLKLIGLPHGILIGISAGLISFVPYLGSITGLVVATCVAIAQFWPNWSLIAAVPAIFFVGQSLADYVLSPYLVGRRVNLNPVWLMFALFAFGYLFGFVGLLIAVPLAAAIGVLLRFALARYYASPLYATEVRSTDFDPSATGGKDAR
jgi:predicted PurR-regulated permease PerM